MLKWCKSSSPSPQTKAVLFTLVQNVRDTGGAKCTILMEIPSFSVPAKWIYRKYWFANPRKKRGVSFHTFQNLWGHTATLCGHVKCILCWYTGRPHCLTVFLSELPKTGPDGMLESPRWVHAKAPQDGKAPNFVASMTTMSLS